ncbi:MAG: glutamine-synthetase adenylyltransferase, partial [Hyphomonadaceae bacterium]
MASLAPIGPALAPAPSGAGPWDAAIAAARAHAPYLARLMARRPELLDARGADWPERLCRDAGALARSVARAPGAFEEGMQRLRQAKDAVHLAVAIADLARAWDQARVTAALTAFADEAVRAALALAAAAAEARGDLVAHTGDASLGPVPGFALIAMGKMGAGELNYSSDIDISIFYDPEALPLGERREASAVAQRLAPAFVRALEEATADGYVFRTDLRLRPDPGATPVAVSIRAAEHYYQHLGQNWERAAFIKARAAAGDVALGEAFLESLQPFIWRKHLDYAAVADVQSIKRQILSTHKSAELAEAVFDVKLGRGGIRDIELFVQTQQLIMGGRNRRLRAATTLGALDALTAAGAVNHDARVALAEAYAFFRDVEHRIQMLEDAHSHHVPKERDARAHLAALCGFGDLADFERALAARRAVVAEIDHGLFGRAESLAD